MFLVKPGSPKLTLHPGLLEGKNDESHYCTGEVGQPPGNLEIQIKRSSDSEFTRYSPPNQKTKLSLVDSENCSSVTNLTFSVDLTSDSWTNVTVRCVVSGLASNQTSEPQFTSSEYIVTSIPSKFYIKHCKSVSFKSYNKLVSLKTYQLNIPSLNKDCCIRLEEYCKTNY